MVDKKHKTSLSTRTKKLDEISSNNLTKLIYYTETRNSAMAEGPRDRLSV